MSPRPAPDQAPYGARTGYSATVAATYEEDRFRGVLGRYRYRREQTAARDLLGSLPTGLAVLDVPCGIGRWWPVLAVNAASITAADISTGMLDRAMTNTGSVAIPVTVQQADAEALPFADDSFDLVWCFALFKHLPRPVQYRVLREIGRVTRRHAVISVGVMGHLSYAFWRRRRLVESFPMMREELDWMAAHAGLRVVASRRCTTPLGVERLVVLERLEAVP